MCFPCSPFSAGARLLLFVCACCAPGLLAAAPLSPQADGSFRFENCSAALRDGVLRIGNDRIQRAWRVEADGTLTALSLKDAVRGVEWIRGGAVASSLGSVQALPENTQVDSKASASAPASVLSAEAGRAGPTEEPSLRVFLRTGRGPSSLEHRFRIFPGAAALVAESGAGETAFARPEEPADPAGGGALAEGTAARANVLERFEPAPKGWTLTRTRIFDRTDLYGGPLVIERTGLAVGPEDGGDAEALVDGARFRGNVFFIEEPASGCGVLWLKHAPLPDERPLVIDPADRRAAVVRRLYDLEVTAGRVALLAHELGTNGGRTYPAVTLLYQGGRAGRIAALQRYHRQRRVYEPGRDGLMLCNFWGEWNSNQNLSEAFLEREIPAAARLGVDVFQIDAGWQRGPYPASIDRKKRDEIGHYGMSPDYWAFHPKRFPRGIAPFVSQAKALGMQFGIWFPPDNVNEQGAWRKDKARVLELHRGEGANYFKFDLLKVLTRRGEARLERLIEELLNETNGRITIDLDVTGGHTPRPGYFGNPHHGPIFVENRFMHYPMQAPMPNPNEYWPRKDRYWPHRTLRNLWLLAQYMDPIRLRMEFMNNQRHQDKYEDDPMAPAHWSPAYLFATVMCSSPLAWMEVQQLPEEYVRQVAPLVAVWKRHREALFRGSVVPIGSEPDGHSWTGFFSAAQDASGGYALLYREDNDEAAWEAPLPLLPAGRYRTEVLAGEGSLTVDPAGRLRATIPAPRGFLFIRLSALR